MTVDELVTKMKTEVVTFFYVKVTTGKIRRARGTLCPDYFSYTRKGNRKTNDSIVIYWDMEKKGFRCFRKYMFLGATDKGEFSANSKLKLND